MIKTKLNECSICGKTKVIWKAKTLAHGPMCVNCWSAYKASEGSHNQPSIPIVTKKKKSFYISPLSAKKARQLIEYRKIRDEYFREHPRCEFLGCYKTNITLHHMKGRVGGLLLDKRYFKSLCMKHHQWVELNPEQAKKMSLSLSRL